MSKTILTLAITSIAIAIFVSVTLYYENAIEEINAKHNTTLIAWEEVAEDYAKLTDDCFDLSKKKTKQIWKLKRLLKECKNNRYYRVWSNL